MALLGGLRCVGFDGFGGEGFEHCVDAKGVLGKELVSQRLAGRSETPAHNALLSPRD